MHHRNHKNSTSNHGNPQHQKPRNEYPTQPAPSSERKSFISKFREKFKEKPASKAEVEQLGLNAKRETYKTMIAKAKAGRPSRFSGFGGGSSGPSYRRTSSRVQQDSGLFGGGGGSFLNFGEGPSLSFLTGDTGRKTRGKQQSGLGQGLTDLF